MNAPNMQTADQVIANTYARFPVMLTKGQDCYVWDDQGRRYTDFVSGIAVCNLGHANPRVTAALQKQAATLVHVSNLYYSQPQIALAQKLVTHCFADRVFFCNSGAEANEAAIKLARRFFQQQGQTQRHRIVSMEKSFHGRTMATLSATGQDKIKKGFDPILDGFDFAPFNDIERLQAAIGPQTCAVMLEPVQGEGGINCPDSSYLAQVRTVCDNAGVLLIFDEIQTGLGRTGKLFAHEHFGAVPDIMTLAKALGNGLPIGAMLATDRVAAAFSPGAHASTFGGTPLVTAAALQVITMLTEEKIVEQGRETGAYFKSQLLALKQRQAAIEDIRGLGLLLGARLNVPALPIVNRCLEQGFLVNAVQEKILRFVPPLTIKKEQIDELIACLDDVL